MRILPLLAFAAFYWVLNAQSESMSDNAPSLDQAPISIMKGPSTEMRYPSSIAVDKDGRFFVSNDPDNVTVYAAVTANQRPVGIIKGLADPIALVVSRKSICVGNRTTNRIDCFDPNDTTYKKTRSLGGPRTGFQRLVALASDSRGRLYVLAFQFSDKSHNLIPTILVFGPGEMDDSVPLQEVSGQRTLMTNPRDLAVDVVGQIYVTNTTSFDERNSDQGVLIFGANANGDVAPLRVIKGGRTNLTDIRGIALDRCGNILVANANSISVFSKSASGEATPVLVLEGPKTQLDYPQRLTFGPMGELYILNRYGDSSVGVYRWPLGCQSAVTPAASGQMKLRFSARWSAPRSSSSGKYDAA
jgi:hypothetical protein